MAKARAIINLALRKLGRLGSGRDARPQDATDALDALQSLYTGWIASGAFGRVEDVVPTGNLYIARGNERVVRAIEGTLEVQLPELVATGVVHDYGRELVQTYAGTMVSVGPEGYIVTSPAQPISYATTPKDGAPVIITDQNTGITVTWLYDGTAKKWQQIDDLQLDSEAPRSEADRDGLAACLALMLADQFAADLHPVTIGAAQRFRMQMTHRYGMRREETAGVYF